MAAVTKPSRTPNAGASFILRVRHGPAGLRITLQDVRTRRLLDLASWDALLAELRRASGDATRLEQVALTKTP